jgi:mannan endo-1,4-beta-mannosidase
LRFLRFVVAAAAVAVAAVIAVNAGRHDESTAAPPPAPSAYRVLPVVPGSYLGIYAPPVPDSYSGVTAFTKATGVAPEIVMYYSGWREQFQTAFAEAAARYGAVPLVEMDPTDVSLTAIAAGKYDAYLTSYADAVRSYGGAVILSFAHEMNGSWYSWGYRHASPSQYVAAWRHTVGIFRRAGADNVTWLWTVNVIHDVRRDEIPNPSAWWPGSEYVNWVGIDGYYLRPSYLFTSLFGPTITVIRELTGDPIIIAETGAPQGAAQPAEIADLATGVRTYGLLGFVWFDAPGAMDWRISSPAAIAAYRAAASPYERFAK